MYLYIFSREDFFLLSRIISCIIQNPHIPHKLMFMFYGMPPDITNEEND